MKNDITTIASLRKTIQDWKKQGNSVAFVPTMGALHDGHLSLVKHAKTLADKVVVSIFVNPTQFGEGEDLEAYPRPLMEDKAKLALEKIDLLYLPTITEMYPPEFATKIHISGITDVLCGASRPSHFDGVALVVTKLLLQVLPDYAIFGQKDFQQLLVIQKLVKELNIPVKISSAAIYREPDGLAMSSRNRYLSKEQRKTAPKLYQTMTDIQVQLLENRNIETALTTARQALKQSGFDVDYLDIRFEDSLEPATILSTERPARLFAAAFLGQTRLIDNLSLEAPNDQN